MNAKTKDLFDHGSVLKAIAYLAIPAVISQVILVIYNMADTFFISLTGNDACIAAVTVCSPAFMFLTAISNLFGIGGSAAISRNLGRKDTVRAESAASFSLFGCIAVTAIYVTAVGFMHDSFINLLGGKDAAVHAYAMQYLSIAVVCGGMAASCSSLLAHLIRAEGHSVSASLGIILGGILNILLDPLFMFVVLPSGNEVLGAAAATALSNLFSLLYFVIQLRLMRKGNTVLRFHFSTASLHDGTASEILMTGFPACIMTLMENISYAAACSLMSSYGTAYQAGLGVAKKINMLAHSFVRGMAQGVLPLIAYTYARDHYPRMKKIIYTSLALSTGISFLIMVVNLIFANTLTGIYLAEGPSHQYAVEFLRILTLGCPASAFAYTVISFFQAVNEGRKSFFLALLRKGICDIPLMFLMNRMRPAVGIVTATPVTDLICGLCALHLFVLFLKGLPEKKVEDKLEGSSVIA